MRASILTSLALVIAAPVVAHAQAFPPDDRYLALACGDAPMSDLYQDESGAIDDRDIVGDDDAPAGLRAADVTFLYLRLRLDADPAPGGTLRPFTWGMELDTDGDFTTYEVLVLVDGINGMVKLYRNSSTTLANDPNDPANEPPVATYALATHVQSAAAGSTFGGNADRFLDVAVPWADLATVGVLRETPVATWAASSTSANSLNGDFACHDGRTGEPTLSGIVSDDAVLDPDVDTDGDGFTDAEEVDAGTDPDDPNDFPSGAGPGRLEGGAGCATSGAADTGAVGLALVIGLVCGIRRARRVPRSATRRGAQPHLRSRLDISRRRNT